MSRKGITRPFAINIAGAISDVLVFFALLAFGDKITIAEDQKLISEVLENFWVLILAIIGFYFGGRSLEKAAEKNRPDPTRKESTDAPKP